MPSFLDYLKGGIAQANPWDNGADFNSVMRDKERERQARIAAQRKAIQDQMLAQRRAQQGGGGSVMRQQPRFTPQAQTPDRRFQPTQNPQAGQPAIQPRNPLVQATKNSVVNQTPNRAPAQQPPQQERPGFLDYLNPFGENGLFGVQQQETYKRATAPVTNKLQGVMDKVNESDKEEGFQWSSKGDYGRFALNLLPGMAQGVIGAPTSVGQAVSGKRVNDQGQVEDLSGVQRGASLADATLSTAGLGIGGSGVLLRSLAPGAKSVLGKGGVKAAVDFVKSAGTESLEEVAQTLAQDLADNGNLEAGWKDYRDAAGLGALGGGIMHGAGAAVQVGKNSVAKTVKEDYKPLVDEARAAAEAAKRENIEQHPAVQELNAMIQEASAQFRAEPNRLIRHDIQKRANGYIQVRNETISKLQREAIINAMKKANLVARRAVPGGTLGGELATGYKDAQARGEVFEGVDGKPRFEVDDSGAKLRDTSAFKQYPGTNVSYAKLGELIDHPQLFDNYPHLRDVEVASTPSVKGRENARTRGANDIEINPELLKDPVKLKSTLLHETQHLIQSKEKFAGGTSPSSAKPGEYFNSAGEAEARAVQARMNMPMSERYKNLLETGAKEKPLPEMKQEFDVLLQKIKNRSATNAESDRYSILKDRIAVAEGKKGAPKPERWVSDKPIKMPDRVYRGTSENTGSGMAMFGGGKYTAASRAEAAKYGTVKELGKESLPSNPLQFKTVADFSQWEYEMARKLGVKKTELYGVDKGAETLVNALGHDGVTIGTGKDLIAVKFTPEQIGQYQPQPTFYDSLDVPKEDLIIRNEGGKAMSVDDPTAAPSAPKFPGLVDDIMKANSAAEVQAAYESRGIPTDQSTVDISYRYRDNRGQLEAITEDMLTADEIRAANLAGIFKVKEQGDYLLSRDLPQRYIDGKNLPKYGGGIESEFTVEVPKNGSDLVLIKNDKGTIYSETLESAIQKYGTSDPELLANRIINGSKAKLEPTPAPSTPTPQAPKTTPQEALDNASTAPQLHPNPEVDARVKRALDPNDKLQYKNLNATERAAYKEAKGASRANQSAKAMSVEEAKPYRQQPPELRKAIDSVIQKENPELFMEQMPDPGFQKEMPKLRPDDVKRVTGLSIRESGIPPRYVSKNGVPLDKLAIEYEMATTGKQGQLTMTEEDYLVQYVSELERRQSARSESARITELRSDPEVAKRAQAILDEEKARFGVPETVEPSKKDVDEYYNSRGDLTLKPTPQDALEGKSTKLSSGRARSTSQSKTQTREIKTSVPESKAAANQSSTQSKSLHRKKSLKAKKPSSPANNTTKKTGKQAYMDAFGVDEATATKDMATVEKGTAKSREIELTDEQLERIEEVRQDEAITKAANKAANTGKRFDFIGVVDKNGRSVGIEVYNPKYHSIKKGKVVDRDGLVVGNHIKVDETGASVAIGEGYTNMDELFGDIRKWKSQNKYTSTLERNIMEAAPDESTGRRVVNWLIGNKVKAERTWKEAIQTSVKKNDARYESVVKDRPKGVSKQEVLSDAMDYGEAQMTTADLTKKYGEEYAGRVTKAIDDMRADYDKYIADINTTRERFGLEPIKKRKDYITHISELNNDKNFVGDISTALKNSITGEAMERTRGGVPADISGRTENFTPTTKWNQYLQQRKGGEYKRDPFKAFNEYVPNAEHNIHMTESVVRARAAEEFLRARTNLASMEAESYGTLLSKEIQKKVKGGPQNDQLVTLFQEYANALAGKTQKLDRAILDSPLRPALKGWQTLQRVGGRATILGNASSVMMQPLNQVNVFAQVKPKAYAKGLANFLTNDKSIEKSNFVQARITHIDSKLRGKGQKFLDAAGFPLRAVEEQSVKLAWHANYQNVLDQGYKGAAAILEADRLTERAVAGRGLADKPEAYRSTAINGTLQYTLEVMAQAKMFWKDLTPAQKAKWVVAASAANTGYALLMNSRPLPDYINAVIAGMGDEDEDDERSLPERTLDTGRRVLGETVKFNPISSNIAQSLPKDAKETLFGSDSDLTRFDGTAAPFRVLDNAYRSGKAALEGNVQEALSRGLRLLPTGNQAQKTGNAAVMNARGYNVDAKGRPTFAAPTSAADKARSYVFGPYATDAAKAYYKDGTGSMRLTASQQEMVDTAVSPEAREELRREYLAINAAKRKAKTDDEKKAATDNVDTPTLDALKKERATENKIERYVNDSISGSSKSTLEKYYSLDETQRDNWFKEKNDNEYKYLKARYENDKANGDIDRIDETKWRSKLRKARVGSAYSQDTRRAYSMSKDNISDVISSASDPDKAARDMYNYDKALYQEGVTKYRKFKKGLTYAVNLNSKGDTKISTAAQKTAKKHGIPSNIFGALIRQESGGNQGAVSSAGATGLTQLMPATAKGLGVNPNDPVQNLEGGARYLAEQYKRFGSWELALAAYNAGPGAVQQYGGIPPFAETQNYVRSIMGSLGDGEAFLASINGKGSGVVYRTIGGDGKITESKVAPSGSSRSSGGSGGSRGNGITVGKERVALEKRLNSMKSQAGQSSAQRPSGTPQMQRVALKRYSSKEAKDKYGKKKISVSRARA